MKHKGARSFHRPSRRTLAIVEHNGQWFQEMPKRADDNQPDVVRVLRQMGVSVAVTHIVGKGFPDIVCGFRGNNWLFEIKNPDKKPSERKLTGDEPEFHLLWKGQIDIIETAEDAMRIMLA